MKSKVITEDQVYDLIRKKYESMNKDILIDIIMEGIGCGNASLEEELYYITGIEYTVVPNNKTTTILYEE